MKKILLLLFAVISLIITVNAQLQKTTVFKSGADGYESYRIPAIIRLYNSDILAFAEGRMHSSSDFGNIDIVMKKSTDSGKTWSALKLIADNDSLQAGNPAPVVDEKDGKVFLFYNTGNQPESQIRKGIGKREVWYKTSADGGETWSAPVNITLQVKRDNWCSYANTPGHAMQFDYGKYKGRIYIAANHSAGEPQPDFEDYHAHGFYTDDEGKTFHLSESISFTGSNEAMAAELENNKLMMNMRNQKGEPRCRITAISSDGGKHWDTAYYDKQLPDPVCQGSILNIGKNSYKNILAFCNNADTANRDNLSLRISSDNGKSWTKSFLIEKKNTAYSDIVKLSENKIGVLYEADGYKEILFTVVEWK